MYPAENRTEKYPHLPVENFGILVEIVYHLWIFLILKIFSTQIHRVNFSSVVEMWKNFT
jgi:hypothetical protein